MSDHYSQQLTIGLSDDQWEAIVSCLDRCLRKHKYSDKEGPIMKLAMDRIKGVVAAFQAKESHTEKWKKYRAQYPNGRPNLDVTGIVSGWIVVLNACMRELHPDASNGCAVISAGVSAVLYSRKEKGE